MKFVLPVSANPQVILSLSTDNDGDVGLFYNNIKVGFFCSGGILRRFRLAHEDRQTLENFGVQFDKNNEIKVD